MQSSGRGGWGRICNCFGGYTGFPVGPGSVGLVGLVRVGVRGLATNSEVLVDGEGWVRWGDVEQWADAGCAGNLRQAMRMGVSLRQVNGLCSVIVDHLPCLGRFGGGG